MPKPYPSQFDCDNMEPGDLIVFKKRPYVYRFIREHLLNDKIKINVRKDWGNHQDEYISYYQEDCVLFYKYELNSTQKKGGILGKKHFFMTYNKIFDVSVDLENLYITDTRFNSIISIPIGTVSDLLELSRKNLLHNQRQSLVKQAVKCCRYDGAFFKRVVSERNIKSWNMMYCSICGKPLVVKFNSDNIDVVSLCQCGNLGVDLPNITYDDFAITFNSQTSDSARKVYDKFWLKSDTSEVSNVEFADK